MIQRVELNGEKFFKIENVDHMRPFFMSIVSSSNHWMFIGSNGGLTAGRKNAEYALFPYYTDDKLIESAETTGSKTIFQVKTAQGIRIWEPFSEHRLENFENTRNLYKNKWGNKLVFEEINHDLNLCFRYQWSSTNLYGFVKTSTLINTGGEEKMISVLDGIQNIMPFGVDSNLQSQRSNLVDAYKRSELEPTSKLGIFALSAIIVDRAEPSEALKANVAWVMGLDEPKILLSSKQLPAFRYLKDTTQETDIKAEKGAYFAQSSFSLQSHAEKQWHIVANVNQNRVGISQILEGLKHPQEFLAAILQNVEEGTKSLIALVASADGIQSTGDKLKDSRHFANSMFNIMRGGVFDHNYQIEKWDFENYLKKANSKVFKAEMSVLDALPELFTVFDLKVALEKANTSSFKRLATEYLPLKFSRRHGDPSRPWNKFSINTISERDGSKILDYEGNWRDIFQNWEALAWSFPAFIEGMIFRFLNASTFDGYNPYRITKDGFDWEVIEPHDPWSYIGYWGDHQIIYLLKFLEFFEDYKPGRLAELFQEELFVYAAVPYRIKPYSEIVKNTKDTIEFDEAWDTRIRQERATLGSDGAVLRNPSGEILHLTFLEKILATTLAKVSNLIPDAGIWMNTQRPEWNDANNALVGNGVSVVTLCYLRRFLRFFEGVFAKTEAEELVLSKELVTFLEQTVKTLSDFENSLQNGFDNGSRKAFMDTLGEVSSHYRMSIYNQGFSGDKAHTSAKNIKAFISLALAYVEKSIEASRRPDSLYHGYNIIHINNNEASIEHLEEMLEGQVAALSSGYLSASQSNSLLNSLRQSDLYRADQNSYMLYPMKKLPGFLAKNNIPQERVQQSELLQLLVKNGDNSVVEKDANGHYHFAGELRNASALETALKELRAEAYGELVNKEHQLVQSIYEEVFNHKAFTGRSGTFYGYEGLGSIYWHMVSKLQLAVQECALSAIEEGEDKATVDALVAHYREIAEGIGVHKPAKVYGAFSIDPYSHTPFWKGAQQPGMTGQVKEDVLSRFGELGIQLENGHLRFNPQMLDFESEKLKEASEFLYVDVLGQEHKLEIEAGSLAFTYCQVLVICKSSAPTAIDVFYTDGKTERLEGNRCSKRVTDAVLNRSGLIQKLVLY